jgi:hypothetical protein
MLKLKPFACGLGFLFNPMIGIAKRVPRNEMNVSFEQHVVAIAYHSRVICGKKSRRWPLEILQVKEGAPTIDVRFRTLGNKTAHSAWPRLRTAP